MKRQARQWLTTGVATIGLLCASQAWAQLVIGTSTGITGPVAAGANENIAGAKLYFDHINDKGGIHGQRIDYVTLDDKFDPKLTVAHARTLITERNALALFMIRGTPHSQAVMPLLNEYKVPLVAPSTGAMVLHKPVHPWIFNVRATYQREAEKAVAHLTSIGVTRIAIVHVDDSFGADTVMGAQRGYEKANLKPLFLEKFDRTKPDFTIAAKKAAQMEPQAIFFVGSAGAVSDGVKAIRAAGSRAQAVTISNNASGGFIKLLGPHAHGTIVAQVFPYERSLAAPIVKEARELAKAKNLPDITPAMMEGYAGAKVLVEGLRRAGANPTRVRLQQALETFRQVDIGGMDVTYTPTSHSGLDYADLSIIDRTGRFMR
jgi:ABC-type branched-subunit amino acid transport system substrate-binding protein